MKETNDEGAVQKILTTQLNRKTFLKYSAIAGSTMAIGLEACHKDDNPSMSNGTVDVGSGDTGILNFAYALEQLEAAFYIQVNASMYSGATNEEKQILADIMNHEIAHRDFFKAALGSSAIMQLQVDFSKIDFTSRASVLATAKALEDTGVSAYNGAGQYITNGDYLTLAGKIVSVEARHAAAIRDLLNPKSASFAGDDVVDPTTGLDFSRTPNAGNPSIVATANTFLKTKISATKLP
ncbi:ferritin-like domain-containing protein [Pinibacter aurantiacus]|uniref:Ferritin-like domain-containing protein n=1 Tax=Pinibacter aurantiacus TaxID=2851599 RepID=A0A9E2S4A3_9BACT|nr:ferritin-like domain-containing protein [Pinibacter aurantiacus]MBV4355626.1 ferritin-like domain-containing protein [Pinibacter aurantiacus]